MHHKKLFPHLLVLIVILQSCKGPDIAPTPSTPPRPIGTSKPAPTPSPVSTPSPTPAPTLSSVVDDKTWVDYLPGTWGVYQDGQDNKFDSYEYTFDKASNIMKVVHSYNRYFTLYDIQRDVLEYKIKLEDKILLYSATGKDYSKYARLEKVSGDEMKWYRIFEGANSYNEYNMGIVTKTNNTEVASSEIIKSTSLKDVLSGKWRQDKNVIYDNILFDFSAGKNFYQYSYNFNGAVTKLKYEFKSDEANTLYYRVWNQSFDPAWQKYQVEVVSSSEINLYMIVNGVKRSTAAYKLTR